MRKSMVLLLGFVVALFVGVGAISGSEGDELRERAKIAKKEAAEAAKAGRREEAEKLARKAAELMEAAERSQRDRPKENKPAAGDRGKWEGFRARFRELIEKERRMRESGAPEKDLKEIREQIAKARAEFGWPGGGWRFGGPRGPGMFGPPLRGFGQGFGAGFGPPMHGFGPGFGPRFGPPMQGFGPGFGPRFGPPMHGFGREFGPGFGPGFAPGFGPSFGTFPGFSPPRPDMSAKQEDAWRKIRHLRAAAMNLRAAGADDLAKQVLDKAEHMEREVRASKMPSGKEPEGRPKPVMGPLAGVGPELRQAIERLRAEIKELERRVTQLEGAKR